MRNALGFDFGAHLAHELTGLARRIPPITAADPAHGQDMLELKSRSDVPGPVTRDPTGAAEFIDAHGARWDVKGCNSGFRPSKGGFDLRTDAGKVDTSLRGGENVVLDTSKMAPGDLAALKAEGVALGWGNRVVYWP